MLLENSRSTNPVFGLLQDLTEPIVTPLSKECRWNVNIPALANELGLKKISYDEAQLGTLMMAVYAKNTDQL